MPCDYKKYHPEWSTRIRPDILERAGNKCDGCGVPNKIVIERGFYNGLEAYQDFEGNIYRADNSEYITSDYLGSLENGSEKFITIVLTISHTDHDISNNEYGNLKALCQRCHNRHDVNHRKRRNKNENQIKLF